MLEMAWGHKMASAFQRLTVTMMFTKITAQFYLRVLGGIYHMILRGEVFQDYSYLKEECNEPGSYLLLENFVFPLNNWVR